MLVGRQKKFGSADKTPWLEAQDTAVAAVFALTHDMVQSLAREDTNHTLSKKGKK